MPIFGGCINCRAKEQSNFRVGEPCEEKRHEVVKGKIVPSYVIREQQFYSYHGNCKDCGCGASKLIDEETAIALQTLRDTCATDEDYEAAVYAFTPSKT